MTIETGQAASPDAEYDDAFAEFSAAKDAATAGDDGHDDGDDDASTAAATDAAATTDLPASSDAGTTAAAATEAAAEPDLWADATPAQRAAFEAAQSRAQTLEHADRSNRGRLSTLQRQLNEYAATGIKPAASDAPRGAAKVRAMFESDAVKTAVSDYGEANAPLVEVMRAQQEVLETLQASADREEQGRTTQYLADQEKAVLAAHPDYSTIARTTAFNDWYQGAPQGVRDMIERNSAQIIDGAEVSAAIRLFKAETGFGQTPPPATAGRTRTDTLRQRQLSGSTSVSNRGPAISAAIPDDFDAAFDAFAAKADAKRRG